MKGYHRHLRFLVAIGIGGAAAGLSMIWLMPVTMRALIGVNSFCSVYLLLVFGQAASMTPDVLRSHAEAEDEGLPLIAALALTAVGISLAAIIFVLRHPSGGRPELTLALASVPLGWAMIHTTATFRYAYMFYADGKTDGLAFAATKEPGLAEFLYLSFGIGMTAQVSDVSVTTARMRNAVTLHAAGSFFYNAVIVALAVNAGISLSK